MTIVTDGLVLYLHGACGKNNPATRVWKDLSGSGNDGRLVNFGYTENSGWVDGGLRFDGVDDYIDCGNNYTITNNLTMEAIIKTDTATMYPRIVGAEGKWILCLRRDTGQLWWYGSGRDEVFPSSPHLADGKYHHVAVVYDGNGINGYVDGQHVGTLSKTGNLGALDDTLVTIGDRVTGGRGFNGTIDEVRIYNRALTDEEIMQNYQVGHEWTPVKGKREVATTMKPITSSLSRKGKGKRELIATMKPITTSLERKGKGKREATTTMKPITASLSRKGTGRREVITTVKPITTSLERKGKGKREVISTMKPITSELNRKGVGRREVITTMQPITSSISKKLPPIHADMDIRERIPKLEVD